MVANIYCWCAFDGGVWIRQATETKWRIGAEATANATKLIIANDDNYSYALAA